jgi:hypothetical protein
MSTEGIPTFKLVLGKRIVACYLATSDSDLFSLNFLIDNIYLVLDGLIPQLLALRLKSFSIAYSWRRWNWKDHFCQGKSRVAVIHTDRGLDLPHLRPSVT